MSARSQSSLAARGRKVGARPISVAGAIVRRISGHAWTPRATAMSLLLMAILCGAAIGTSDSPRRRLPRDQYKNGAETLRAFSSICAPIRDSIVKLDLDGNTVALAVVIDHEGLAVTKGSEIKAGKLTGWLANGQEAAAELICRDEENDLALVKVQAKGLKAISWATGDLSVGQWVVTPGITETPQGVGIISVPTRKIPPPRALIGVQLDQGSSAAKIDRILSGLGAEKAGLKAGDLILAVNGTPTKAGDALIKRLREFREGQIVKLRVQRDDQEFESPVEMMIPKPRNGRDRNRSEFMDRMGTEPSERTEGFALAIQHDTALQAWQCGGPLLDLDGKAIGLNIARAGRVASYALPADLVKSAVRDLKAKAAALKRHAKN
jgi:serine protease Do